jgi:hypothetical protein
MSVYCEICNKSYTSEKTYLIHLKKSYKHQKTNPYQCEFCNKEYANSSSYSYHKTVCKSVKHKTIVDEIECLKKQIEVLQEENEGKNEELKCKEQTIHTLQEENALLKIALKEKQVALDTTKEVMKEMKPTTLTNNIYNNKTFIQTIANGLVPICDDEIRETVDKLNIQHFKQGPKGVVKFVTTDYLAPRVICTDASRHTTVWKDENKEIIHDSGSRKLSEKVSTIIGEKDYKPMLDSFNASIDQTCPEDLIEMNTAYNSVLQFKHKRQEILDELARGISKGVKTVKQITDSKNTFLNCQQNIKSYVFKNITNIVLGGLEGVFKTLIKHFQSIEDFELLTEIEKVKKGEYMWFSSKESSCTYLLDDSSTLIIDKHHELIVNIICKFLYCNKDCSPFTVSLEDCKKYYENSSEYCELYQECINSQ